MKNNVNMKRYFLVLGICLSILLVIVLAVLGFEIWKDMFEDKISGDKGLAQEEIATEEIEADIDLWSYDFEDESQLPERINFLLLCVDEDGMRSDTIMVASYDRINDEVSVLSIPRDTKVYANGMIRKINATSAYKRADGKAAIGPQGVVDSVTRLTGIPIHYYISFTFRGVERLIDDVLGPVEYNVEFPMIYDDPAQNLHINLEEGPQTLDGEKCVHYLRYRKANKGAKSYVDGSDTGRIKRQQQFLQEIARQKLKLDLGIVTKAGTIIEIAEEELKTNLTVEQMVAFAKKFAGYKSLNVVDMENPEATTNSGGLTVRMLSLAGRNSLKGEYKASYWICDLKQTREDVMNYFGVDEETAAKITDSSTNGTNSTSSSNSSSKSSSGKSTSGGSNSSKSSSSKSNTTKKTYKPSSSKATTKPVTNTDDKDDDIKSTLKPTKSPTDTKEPTSKPGTNSDKDNEEKVEATKKPTDDGDTTSSRDDSEERKDSDKDIEPTQTQKPTQKPTEKPMKDYNNETPKSTQKATEKPEGNTEEKSEKSEDKVVEKPAETSKSASSEKSDALVPQKEE